MIRPVRRLSLSRIAQLKSLVAQLRLVERRLRSDELSRTGACAELQSIQIGLYQISRTSPKAVL